MAARRGRLGRGAYAGDPVALAKGLIGARLVRLTPAGRLAGRIVETEAYCGTPDRASHSFGGRRTARTEPMYGAPGTAYVFRTYGLHAMFNVVCGEPGDPVAVLVRALEPLEGIDAMEANRLGARKPMRSRPIALTDLCSGPAKLAQALAIGHGLSGADLTVHPGMWIEGPLGLVPEADLENTKRIGVDYAEGWADRPLRWYLRGSPHVSRPLFPPLLAAREGGGSGNGVGREPRRTRGRGTRTVDSPR